MLFSNKVNYFAIGMPYGVTRELVGWVRQRVRLYYWKQWGRPRTRTALRNEWLEAQGVPNLVHLWKTIRYPEQPETLMERISKL